MKIMLTNTYKYKQIRTLPFTFFRLTISCQNSSRVVLPPTSLNVGIYRPWDPVVPFQRTRTQWVRYPQLLKGPRFRVPLPPDATHRSKIRNNE